MFATAGCCRGIGASAALFFVFNISLLASAAEETAESLLEIARKGPVNTGTPEIRERAIAALRRIQERFPERGQEEEVLSLIGACSEWSFLWPVDRFRFIEHPRAIFLPPTSETAQVEVQVSHSRNSKRPASIVRIRRVDPPSLRKALDASVPGTFPFFGPEIAKDVVQEWMYVEGQLRREDVLAFPAGPGWYLLEETIDGFVRRWPVVVESPRALGLLVLAAGPRAVAFTFNMHTTEPEEGVQLKVRMQEKTVELRTDGQGLAFFDCPWPATVVATRGSDFQFSIFGHRLQEEPDRLACLTLDKPVYLPGETVRWKAVLRDLKDGRLSLPPEHVLHAEIIDADGDAIAAGDSPINDFGSSSGVLRIPEGTSRGVCGVRLGDGKPPWRLSRRAQFGLDGLPSWTQTFRVVKLPEGTLKVHVELSAPPTGAIGTWRARFQTLTGDGRPVAGAWVEWSARVRRISRLNPGDDPALWLDPRNRSFDPILRAERSAPLPTELLDIAATGGDATDSTGGLEASFEVPEGEVALELRVEAIARDPSGDMGAGDARVLFQPRVRRLTLSFDRNVCFVGQEAVFMARVTDLEGRPLEGSEVRFEGRMLRLNSVDGHLKPSELTDRQGIARVRFVPEAEGRGSMRGSIDGGPTREREFWVSGPRAGPEEKQFAFAREGVRFNYAFECPVGEEGDRIPLHVRTSRPGTNGLLVFFGSGACGARPVRLDALWNVIPFEVPRLAVPACEVSIWQAEDIYGFGGGIYFGATLAVFPRDRLLGVELSADRPGDAGGGAPKDEIHISLRTTLLDRPEAAEVELSVMEVTAIEFAHQLPPDLRTHFYRFWAQPFESASNVVALEIETVQEEPQFPWRPSEAYGKAPGSRIDPFVGFGHRRDEDPIRGQPPRSIFYAPQLRTGPDGRLDVRFNAPRDAGLLLITARAVAVADRFGEATMTLPAR